ncbi:hypothetical protein N7491_009649 [Penicillium cf. griseofulvum]|uniref:Uncharacterized protein n=1 Tax=Penicillium cf. griseofulvum TaxID=2972120 RepID=A0A9W9JP29_9EURO|nr:hypothetical protein N7472_004755 [Penicillium cf. griseofulvum]KAJ5424433.1 hypothetical protein N7491_009649 [Penicillium cf. griseofulvum]KAJ5442324.1 hypothetical protein N7445_005331 [Penicillium cf. griseofulvum]
MENAYGHRRANCGLEKIPAVIAKQAQAIDSLLASQPGGYILQAFRLVADTLDDTVPFDHPRAKNNRKSTIKRLNLHFTDGAQRPLLIHPDKHSAHLYIVLDKTLDRFVNSQKLLSSGMDPNVRWKRSRLILLQIAAQEGKQDKDLHNQLLVNYARAAGPTEIVKLLEDWT